MTDINHNLSTNLKKKEGVHEMNKITIMPEVELQLQTAVEMAITAKSLTIANNTQYEKAVDFAKKVKDLNKDLEATRKSLTKPLDDQKSEIMDRFRGPQKGLEHLEGVVKKAMLDYINRQEEIDREAKEKALSEAKKAEDERKKQLEVKAQDALEAGDNEKSMQLLDEIDQVFVPVVVNLPEKPVVGGVTKKRTWTYEVVDINKVPREYLIINDAALKALATSTKGAMKIDGIKFVEKKNISIGR